MRCSFFSESTIFTKCNLAKGIERFQALFLLFIVSKPDIMIGMRICKSLEKSWKAITVKVNALTKEAARSKVDALGETGEQRKVWETCLGRRVPSTHISTQEKGRLGRATLQSSLRLFA